MSSERRRWSSEAAGLASFGRRLELLVERRLVDAFPADTTGIFMSVFSDAAVPIVDSARVGFCVVSEEIRPAILAEGSFAWVVQSQRTKLRGQGQTHHRIYIVIVVVTGGQRPFRFIVVAVKHTDCRHLRCRLLDRSHRFSGSGLGNNISDAQNWCFLQV